MKFDYDGGVCIKLKNLVIIPVVLGVMVLATFPVVFASHSTPLNGSFSGSFTLTSQTAATISGSGHLDHLGQTTFAALSTDTGPASCQGGFALTEKDTFTAANGDKLFITANEAACPTSTHSFQLTGPWTITGGTGRFEHASGSGSVDINAAMTSQTGGTFTATTTGTITY